MILFDSSVIIDARDPDSPFHRWAKERIAEAVIEPGQGGVNAVVIAEASVKAKHPASVPAMLEAMGLHLLPLPVSAAVPAAKAFAAYLARLKKEGKPRVGETPLPDFFIGAHAHAEELELVTRDPDRVKTYFPDVKLVTP
jgi:predicted nucleic acid-binding protein